MAQDISESGFSGRIRPVNFVVGNASRDSHGALPHILEIMQEWLNRLYFHAIYYRRANWEIGGVYRHIAIVTFDKLASSGNLRKQLPRPRSEEHTSELQSQPNLV